MTTFLDQRVLERIRAEYLEMPGALPPPAKAGLKSTLFVTRVRRAN